MIATFILFLPFATQGFAPHHGPTRRCPIEKTVRKNDVLTMRPKPVSATSLYLGLADMMDLSGGLTSFLPHDISSTPITDTTSPDSLVRSTMALAERRMSESAFLNSLGHDVLVFLATTAIVVPLSRFLGVTPVLGFLAAGFLVGPYGIQIFGNTEADVALGDFGILFLLFAEGLNLSPDRLKRLGAFGKLGVVQLLASMGLLFVGLVAIGPYIIQYAAPILQMDASLKSVFESPEEAFCIAAAGALSSSAFVLPVLKEKGWEDRQEGIAALSVLLLQDVAVAPLLVILPLVAGAGPQTGSEFGILIAKATVGFGAVLYAGSWILKKIFDVVAEARSTETFVAAALLVAVSMGQAADVLGLSVTTGAFAAGVLLANNKYRAQIKADIQPFEGLLLGIFFVTAGASLDPRIIMSDFPTLMLGISVFMAVKAAVLYLAGPALGNTRAQTARVAITLAGGGEFSLVLLNLARDLGLLSLQLCQLLSASVVISMSLTPVLAEIAAVVANILERSDDNILEGARSISLKQDIAGELFDKIDFDGSGSIEYEELRTALLESGVSPFSVAEIFESFNTDSNGSISREEWNDGMAQGYLAQAISHDPGTLVEMKEMNVKVASDAIVICGYTEFGREMYQVLEAAGCTRNGGVVAFDLNPSRVAAGLLAGVNVVYGNAASPELLRAAGVVKPRGVVVAFRSEAQRLETSARMREAFDDGTLILSRVVSGQSVTRDDVLKAGATDVVSERTEAALRFAVLLGALGDKPEWSVYRQLLSSVNDLQLDRVELEPDPIPGISEGRLADMCDDFGCSRRDLLRLYDIFSSLPDTTGDQYVAVDELEEVFLRMSGKPIDDETAERWREAADCDGVGIMSFVDFAGAFYRVAAKI